MAYNHCYSSLHEPSEVSHKTSANREEEKDSPEMPCLPRMAHKAPVMQASNRRHDERKRYWCLSVGLVLKNSFNDTIFEENLDVEKGERFACMSS